MTETREPTPRPAVPPLHLEQLARDELSPERKAAVLARLGPDADAQLAALAASDREILAAHPPARVAAEVQRRSAPPATTGSRPRVHPLWFAAPTLAVAALAVLVLLPTDDPLVLPETHAPADPPYGVRIKGLEPRLVVHRKAGDDTVELTSPADVRARDVLQLSYIAAGAKHGVILSLDGNGLVTLHHPAGTHDATDLRQDGAVRLPQSYELDDAPRFERFLFLTSDDPIDVARALAAARALASAPNADSEPLALPFAARQTSFLARKADR